MTRRQLLLSAAAASPNAKVELRFHADWLSNLLFGLDAMAGGSGADGAAYRRMWESGLGWSREDERQLMRWKESRSAALAEVQDGPPVDWPPNYPSFYGSELSVGHRLRMAGLRSDSIASFRRDIRRVAGERLADSASSVASHFSERFKTYWDRHLKETAQARCAVFRRLVEQHDLNDLAASLMRFTGADLGKTVGLDVHVIVREERFGRNTMATQFGPHAPVEILDSEPAERKIGVVLHELAHYFYDSAPRANHQALIDEFRRQKPSWRMAAYSYLNEAIATAAGILVEKRLRTRDAFEHWQSSTHNIYSQPWIAALGRGIYELVEQRLEQGLFNNFAAAYLERTAETLGDRIRHPHFLLASRVIVSSNPSLRRAVTLFRERVPAVMQSTGWEALRRFSAVPVVLLAAYNEVPAALERIGKHRSVTPITGGSAAEVEEAVERFAVA